MNQEYTLFSQGTSDPIPYHMPTIKNCNRKWQPTPVSLPGKFHEQENLVGYSTQGHRESTERLSTP